MLPLRGTIKTQDSTAMKSQLRRNRTSNNLIMSRYSPMSFSTMIFLFVNLILISSTVQTYDVDELSKEAIQLTEDNIVSPIELKQRVQESRFIGDLIIGQHRPNEVLYYDSLDIVNPYNNVNKTSFNYSVQRGIIHYVSIVNDVGSYAAVCDLPYSLGTSKSYFNVRVVPNSRSKLWITVAAH